MYKLVGNDLFVFYESGPGNMLSFRQLPLDRILNFLKGKGRDSDWLLEMHRKNSLGLHRIPDTPQGVDFPHERFEVSGESPSKYPKLEHHGCGPLH